MRRIEIDNEKLRRRHDPSTHQNRKREQNASVEVKGTQFPCLCFASNAMEFNLQNNIPHLLRHDKCMTNDSTAWYTGYEDTQ